MDERRRVAADAARADAARLEERLAMAVARIELLDERLAKVEAADPVPVPGQWTEI